MENVLVYLLEVNSNIVSHVFQMTYEYSLSTKRLAEASDFLLIAYPSCPLCSVNLGQGEMIHVDKIVLGKDFSHFYFYILEHMSKI